MQKDIELSTPPEKHRLSELDWLRVILIFGVFAHHAFMPFNGDGWHITNSTSSKLLDDIMVYFEQVRLPILFFVAGAGSTILIKRMQVGAFVQNKFFRLVIPLIVGTVVVVPIQLFYEEYQFYTGSQSFGAGLLRAYTDSIIAGKTNHLWFLDFLIVFMALLALVAFGLQRIRKHSTRRTGLLLHSSLQYFPFAVLVSIGVVVTTVRLIAKLYYPTQGHDLFNFSVSLFYLCFFGFGAGLVLFQSQWMALKTVRYKSLSGLVISSLLFYGYYYSGDMFAQWSLESRWQMWWGVCSAVTWFALLTLVGFTQSLLTHTPRWLQSTNRLIFPFYILHQSVIVIVAFYVVALDLNFVSKTLAVFCLSLAITVLLCVYLIDKTKITRFLFGVREP